MTITIDQLLETAKQEMGYEAKTGNDMVSKAVVWTAVHSVGNKKTIEEIIKDGANGESDFDIYTADLNALRYFEENKFEINECLADLEMDASNIIGMDKRDRLCLGNHNKIALAKWGFEYAMSTIADWFEIDYEF